jgi:hypothetical protein
VHSDSTAGMADQSRGAVSHVRELPIAQLYNCLYVERANDQIHQVSQSGLGRPLPQQYWVKFPALACP